MNSPSTRIFDRLVEIEERARALQINVYKQRHDLWNNAPPQDRIDLVEPGIGLQYLGYSIQSVTALGEWEFGGVRNEVAGQIDHSQKCVTISERHLNPVKRFVAAHELGHALLHPNGPTMHRDLPLERRSVVHDIREVEANRFASAWLMPRKWVEEYFKACFRLEVFELTDQTAYGLYGTNADRLQDQLRSLRQLSQCIAGTVCYSNQYFVSLSEKFKVSSTAAAIRLEELGLVTYNLPQKSYRHLKRYH